MKKSAIASECPVMFHVLIPVLGDADHGVEGENDSNGDGGVDGNVNGFLPQGHMESLSCVPLFWHTTGVRT